MSRIIQVGIASYGMSGLVFHGPLLKVNPHFQVRKVFERSKSNATKHFSTDFIVRSYQELLDDDQIELIIVNTPDTTHFDYAMRALKAGKHIIVEKPFVQRVEEGKGLIQIAKENGLLISVFQNRRWDSDFLTAKMVIEKGFLGRLVEFESHYDRYRNYVQDDTWKEDPAAGASLVYNLGSHLIDQALCLFGKPESVLADIRKIRTDTKVDDFFDIDLYYPDVKVKLKSSYLVREEGPRFILHGTSGSFLKWGIDPQEERLKAGFLPDSADWGFEDKKFYGLLNTEIESTHFRGRIASLPGNYPAFYQNIYRVLRQNDELDVKAEQSLHGIKIIQAAYHSAQTGQKVIL